MNCCRLLVALLLGLAPSCGTSKVDTSQLHSTSSFRLALFPDFRLQWPHSHATKDQQRKTLRSDLQAAGLGSRCACTKRTELSSTHVPKQATLVAGKRFCVHKPEEIKDHADFYRMTAECFGHEDKVSHCLPKTGNRTIYLIGDCHAYINVQPALRLATSLPVYFYGNNLPAIESSEEVFQAVVDRLRVVLKPNDLVVFSEILTGDDSKSEVTQAQLDSFESRLTETSELCAEKHAKMVIMGDTPALPIPPLLCRLSKNCSASEADIRSQQKAKRDILASVLKSSPAIKWFDYMHLFCHNGVCDQFIPGTKIEAFTDDDHLNRKGAQYLWPFMCEWLESQQLL
eukprot:TRINITY_DN14990_c0_g1_i3.p1 TRINITY_DN14990_c0_g1~~TRINITY_DN14990_c0_g1_i3.p1  ORF type:complete len:343 (+),score=57.56 TRINITY_DN14990_c0_g1_i3:87-1115(+)